MAIDFTPSGPPYVQAFIVKKCKDGFTKIFIFLRSVNPNLIDIPVRLKHQPVPAIPAPHRYGREQVFARLEEDERETKSRILKKEEV